MRYCPRWQKAPPCLAAQRGLDLGGADSVDDDAGAFQLLGQDLGQAADAPLGHAVGGQLGGAVHAGGRGNVDDAGFGRTVGRIRSALYSLPRLRYTVDNTYTEQEQAIMENEKIILDIVVDVQKDFITGALVNAEAQANVAHLAEVARTHAQAGHWMFFTKDTHPEEYLDTREGRRLPVEHCIEGTDGWNFAPELEDAMDDTEPEVSHIVCKKTFGAYMLPSDILDELMAHNKAVDDIEKIIVYGYCTDICVISNAMVLRAAFPEMEIEILSDCCAGVTPESHQTALDAMRACQFTIV